VPTLTAWAGTTWTRSAVTGRITRPNKNSGNQISGGTRAVGAWWDVNISSYLQQEGEIFTRTTEPQEQERKDIEGRDLIERVRRMCVCVGVPVSPHAVWNSMINVAAVGRVL